MSPLFKKTVAYITGAGQGLGRATAIHLASLGAKVVVVDVSEKNARNVADEIGQNAIATVVDITDATQVKKSMNITLEKWSTINCVVNCAGI